MLKLYSSLASWWPLISPPEEYREEAVWYWQTMCTHARRTIRTILELGSGGGHSACHLKQHAQLTLTDLSPDMLEVNRTLNPECEHIVADMRDLRLGRRFDAVFIHDAVMYLTLEDDLFQTMRTAFEHCEPGGVALFVPDCTRETWKESVSQGGTDGVDRSARYLEWTYDPDPTDNVYVTDMVYLLREANGFVQVESERHQYGLFSERTWLKGLATAGFDVRVEEMRLEGDQVIRAFVGRVAECGTNLPPAPEAVPK